MSDDERQLIRDLWEKLNLYRDEAVKGPIGHSYIGGARIGDLCQRVKAALETPPT